MITHLPIYRIKDWEKHFENSESRKYKSLSWVPVKNKHDGKGYRRVVAHPKSVQVLCAWYLIVQVASKMPTRGVLLDDDGPITTTDMYFKTGMPEIIFEVAFEVLSDSKIGWLETDSPGNLRICPENPGETDGEQNRTEQNRTKLRESAREADFPEVPDWNSVSAHAQRIGLAEWKAKDWFDEMEGCGWKDHHGRQVCKWQSVLSRVRTKWEADGRPNGPPAQAGAQGGSKPPTVFQLKTVMEAKENLANQIKFKFASDVAGGVQWSDQAKRAEWQLLRKEIKELNARIARS